MNSYLIIKVEGKIIEKFILRCKKNNINLLKIERISNKEIIAGTFTTRPIRFFLTESEAFIRSS